MAKTFFDSVADAQTRIVEEAWFEWNPNISSGDVAIYQKRAYSMVLSVVQWIYDIDFGDDDYSGSIAQDILQDAEAILWAWFFIHKSYNSQSLWTLMPSDWWDKVMEWKSILKQISKWEIKLYNSNNQEYNRVWWESTWADELMTSVPTDDRTFSKDYKE